MGCVRAVEFPGGRPHQLRRLVGRGAGSEAAWKPGDTVTVDVTLKVTNQHMQNLAAAGIKPDSFILLVTAERAFDAAGHLHLPNDQYMSTLITPTDCRSKGVRKGR